MKVKITGGTASIEGREHGPGDVVDVPQDVARSLELSRTVQIEVVKSSPAPIAPPAQPAPPAPKVEKGDQVKASEAKASGKPAAAKKKKGAKSAKAKKGKGKK